MATTAAIATPLRPGLFPLRHPWDRNFFLAWVALVWLGILAGFVPEIVRNIASGARPLPAIVHVHAVVFVGWLVLLTTQLLLVRAGQLGLHRKLGYAGALLAVAMVVVGAATALTVQRDRLGTPGSDPAFLSVQLIDMIEFAGLAAAAVATRKVPSAHKRLILLATISIADAGFSRWVGAWLYGYLGDGAMQFPVELFGAGDLLVLGIGAYDWITRRRLHPAWVFGAAWILAGQATASWLHASPSWNTLATGIISAWPW